MAARVFRKACDLGSAGGCLNLGRLQAGGELGDEDPRAAARSYKKGCARGAAAACEELGLLYVGALEIQPGAVRIAADAFDKACRGGSGKACFHLGKILRDDGRVKGGSERALEAFRRGCDAGHAAACLVAHATAEHECEFAIAQWGLTGRARLAIRDHAVDAVTITTHLPEAGGTHYSCTLDTRRGDRESEWRLGADGSASIRFRGDGNELEVLLRDRGFEIDLTQIGGARRCGVAALFPDHLLLRPGIGVCSAKTDD